MGPDVAFVEGTVSVSVPATSANLGPGYDCLGIALELADTLVAEVADGLEVHVAGEGAGEVPLDERHLVIRSMLATFAAMDVSPPGLHLSCTNRIPHSRGLGSSSAAIIGGIVLARSLVEGGADAFDDAAALSLASLIEGHPDNVAPALLGGFVISGQTGDEVWAQQSPVDPSISAVVFVPPHGVHTACGARYAACDRFARRRDSEHRSRGSARRGTRRASRNSSGVPPRTSCTNSSACPPCPSPSPWSQSCADDGFRQWFPVPVRRCWPSSPTTPKPSPHSLLRGGGCCVRGSVGTALPC